MKTCKKLPKSHMNRQLACIELERSHVLARLIKVLSAALFIVLFVLGCLILPTEALTEMDDVFVHLVVLVLGMMSVFLVHELMRGLLMRIFSGVKPVIKYAGSYPHAGCEAYFDRVRERIICLVPPLVIAAVLLILLFTTADMSWKWIIWLILMVGVCSSVGDVYVSIRMTAMPADILVENVGSSYLIYSASAAVEQPEKK